jgi:hypothetical protein
MPGLAGLFVQPNVRQSGLEDKDRALARLETDRGAWLCGRDTPIVSLRRSQPEGREPARRWPSRSSSLESSPAMGVIRRTPLSVSNGRATVQPGHGADDDRVRRSGGAGHAGAPGVAGKSRGRDAGVSGCWSGIALLRRIVLEARSGTNQSLPVGAGDLTRNRPWSRPGKARSAIEL